MGKFVSFKFVFVFKETSTASALELMVGHVCCLKI